MSMRVCILGSGSSGGVPRIDGHWGVCDPLEPKNHRSRASIYITLPDGTGILVDTAPELRTQFIKQGIKELDALLYTHDHADQSHGIDDVRAMAHCQKHRKGPIPTYANPEAFEVLRARFPYCFFPFPLSDYPPIMALNVFNHNTPFKITTRSGESLVIQPFLCYHGNIKASGFRIGDFAYSPDVHAIPEESFDILKGVKVWVVDALRYKPHPSHAHVDLAVEWLHRINPERGILTNLLFDLDYHVLKDSLPKNIEPAYDGMIFEI
jgi:phosphoribosyl 1,2-cyclic phosphate phosphodiesterase